MSRSPLERSNSVASGIDSDDEIVEELDETDILGHLELTATPDENTSSSSPQRELGTLRGGLPTAFTANSSTSPQRIAVTVQSPKPHLNVAIPNLNDYDTSPARRNVSGSSTLMPPPSPPRLFLEQQRRDEKKREKEKEQEQTTCCARSHAFWFPASLPTSWGYQITWIVDAVVMSILKYVFCVVGAVIIHDSHKMFKQSLAIGIGVQCASTFVTCLITSGYSKLGINISGPDIIAAIFAGQWASALTDPSALTIVTEIQALPTLLFLIAASTLIMGLLWLAIGYTGATRVVDFMPQPVVSGFLACIGWKVLKYAAKVSTGPAWYTWDAPGFTWPFFMLLLPAIPLGVPLYLLKRFHIGNPMVVLPFFLVVPMCVFWMAFGLQDQNNMQTMREIHWMFPDYPRADFWQIWTELKFEHIAWDCIPRCLPDMAIMILILILDSFLKLSSTKGALKVSVDMMHEMKVTGWENIIGALFVSAPGYPQVKFNLLSHGILGNVVDRKVGVIVGLFCGIMWLSGFMLVSILPRFLLGGLLLYAACPFLVDNLWTSYFHMSKMEYGAIWGIFCTVVIGDIAGLSFALLLAVVVGLVFSTIIFMVQYAQVSVIRHTYQGTDYQSKVVRTYWEEALISRVGGRSGFIQLEGFIFFASAAQLVDAVRDMIIRGGTEKERKENRIRHLVLDFEFVTNIDYSGVVRLLELRRIVKNAGIALYISGLREGGVMENALAVEGVFEPDDDGYVPTVCEDMDRAAEIVENQILERASKLRANWLIFDSFKKLHTEAQLRQKFELLEVALGTSANVGHDLWRYGQPIEKKKGDLICKEGDHNRYVYLLQRGKVTSFTILDDEDNTVKVGCLLPFHFFFAPPLHPPTNAPPSSSLNRANRPPLPPSLLLSQRLRTCAHGAVINDECIFHDLPCAHSTVAEEDCLLWKLSVDRLQRMETAQPKLAVSIHRHILNHAAVCRHRLEREVNSLEHPGELATGKGRRRGTRNLAKGRPTKSKKDSRANRFVEHSLGDTVLNRIRNAHLSAHNDAAARSSQLGVSIHEHEEANQMEAHTLVEIEAMQHHHKHHYHHLHVDRHMESTMSDEEIARWSAIKPHMSIVQRRSAIKWFLFHAREHAHAENMPTPPRFSDVRYSKQFSDEESSDRSSTLSRADSAFAPDSPVEFSSDGSPLIGVVGPTMSSPALPFENTRLLLNIEEVQKCLMDLGLFPSTEEVRLMHRTMGPDAMDSNGRFQIDGIDESEFLKMVEVMTLAEVSPAQISTLHEIFEEYSIEIRQEAMPGKSDGLMSHDRATSQSENSEYDRNAESPFLRGSDDVVGSFGVGGGSSGSSSVGLGSTVSIGSIGSHASVAKETKGVSGDDTAQVYSTARGGAEGKGKEKGGGGAVSPSPSREKEVHMVKVLTERGLGHLLAALDHPDDEIELHCIMTEWDVKQLGYLKFESLVSIVATYMKIEQLDQQVEEDYLRICGYSVEKQRQMSPVMKIEAEISPEALFDAVMKYAPRRILLNFSIDDAKEMVYDADLQHEDNNISLDELITCLEMVGDMEALAEGDEKKGLWRAPSGRHLLSTAGKDRSLRGHKKTNSTATSGSRRANANAPSGFHEKKTRRTGGGGGGGGGKKAMPALHL